MNPEDPLLADLEAIRRIEVAPKILATIQALTGMRYSGIARVTPDRWLACAVLDHMDFGLGAGGELELESTLCSEIRNHRGPIAFSEASRHPVFATHRTPKMYGLESYVSVPIFKRNDELWGTLFAVDHLRTDVERPEIVQTMQLFADLIGMQLDLTDKLDHAHSALDRSRSREQLLVTTEREIRGTMQPILTGIYLLRGSSQLTAEDRNLVNDMDEAGRHIMGALRQALDVAFEKVAQAEHDENEGRSAMSSNE